MHGNVGTHGEYRLNQRECRDCEMQASYNDYDRSRQRQMPPSEIEPMLLRLIVLLSALLMAGNFVGAAQADAYRWTGPTGQTVYGDDPPAQAAALQRVDIVECNTLDCRLAETARAADAEKRHREIETWLDRRAKARESSKPRADRVVYIPVYAPPYPVFIRSRNVGIHRGLHRRHRLTEKPLRQGRSSRLRQGARRRIRLH